MSRLERLNLPEGLTPANEGMAPIYLDHNASTPPAIEVVEAMLPWLGSAHSNPHSEHLHAHRAAAAVEDARTSIAELIGADAEDILFTSGATESNNLILQGLLTGRAERQVLAVSAIEHKSVLETANMLGHQGVEVITIPVDRFGKVDPAWIQERMLGIGPSETGVVSVMHANNEIGTLQPIVEISRVLRPTGAFFHSDVTQSFGKVPINVGQDEVDFMSISAHKIYGPSGIGAVYIAPGLRDRIRPIMFGGGQQHGLRPGTIPVFLAVGFGAASRLASKRIQTDAIHSGEIVEHFLSLLKANGLSHQVLGDPEKKLPGLVSLRLTGVDASALVSALGEDLCASTGSACTAGELHSSHVLRAIGLSEEQASEVIRLGFGRGTSIPDAERAALLLIQRVRQYLTRSV